MTKPLFLLQQESATLYLGGSNELAGLPKGLMWSMVEEVIDDCWQIPSMERDPRFARGKNEGGIDIKCDSRPISARLKRRAKGTGAITLTTSPT
jgi:hypothetical protein